MHAQFDKKNTWEKYTACWGMQEDAARVAAFSEVLAEHAVYTDPHVQTSSWSALITYMENFQSQLPGGYFVTSDFQTHHDKSIAHWEMKTADGITIGIGCSYGEYNEQGKLFSINGFFEKKV
jgi:hypothetical protein